MSFLEKFSAALPQGMSINDLKCLVVREAWQNDPEQAAIQALRISGKFDAGDYLERYPDVAREGIDPVQHFVLRGMKEQRFFNCTRDDHAHSSKVRLAYQCFKEGKYAQSLELYEELAEQMGRNNFAANIALCQKRLGDDTALGALYEKNTRPQPKVSILVPVYNNAQYLHECIDSIINQTLREIEIIIINDGSTDPRAVEILNDYARKDARIKLIHKRNTGYGHSMNCGLNAATGKYIGIVESDDYIVENMYEVLLRTAELYDLNFIKCNFKVFYGSGKERSFVERNITTNDGYYGRILNPQNDIELFKVNNVIWNGIYSRDFLKSNNIYFNETPGASYQDNGFYFQIYMYADRIMFIEDMLYMLRRDNQESSVFSKEKVFCMCDEYYFIENIIRKNKYLYNKFLDIFYHRKFGNYMFTYNRIGDQYKETFLKKIASEFLFAVYNNELNKDYLGNTYDKILNIVKKYHKIEGKKTYDYYASLDKGYYKYELAIWYQKKMGKELHLDNPVTYNEKIQWMKLYGVTPLMTELSDKLTVRSWIEDKIGKEYLIPLLGVWDNFDAIDFGKLPEKFVLKANHGCGWNIIVDDKSRFNKKDAREKFNKRMKLNFAFCNGFEMQYSNILPKIICEEYIRNNEKGLTDYKFFCFNGKVKYITVVSERYKNVKRFFYDTEWNKQKFTYSTLYEDKLDLQNATELGIEKPHNLEKIIEIAERLSRGFSHVRVDFYILNDGKIKFGEMTFTSNSGTCFWIPDVYDSILGNLFDIDNGREPKISVIIPVHNGGKFLNECLQSVCNQTLKDIEIICVDDASTDDSAKILSSFAEYDPRITVITHAENTGAGIARNHGLEIAQGKYISFLDADDIFEKHYLESMYTACEKHDLDFVTCRCDLFDANTKEVTGAEWAVRKELLPAKQVFSIQDTHNIFKLFTGWAWDKLYRRQFILDAKLKFQGLETTNDMYFTFMALVKANRISVVDDVLVHHRTNVKNSVSNTREKCFDNFYKALLAIRDDLIELKVFDDLKRDFINYALHAILWNANTLKGNAVINLYKKVTSEWDASLQISLHREEFFYNKFEYNKYMEMFCFER